MEFLGVGFLIGIIVTIVVVSLVMISKEEQPERCERNVTLGEMLSVVNYYYHFGRTTPYEKEVMTALMEKLEDEMNGRKSGEDRVIKLARQMNVKLEGME